MKLEEIKELVAVLEKGTLKKIAIKRGDFELQLEKESSPARQYHEPMAAPPPHPARSEGHEEHKPHSAKPAAAAVKGGKYVTSPMVGTFYATPSPDQPPFVKVGDKVLESTVVCIIEAMKVMNEVKAGVSGTVVEILADHTQPVEFGTKLFRIE